MRDVAVVGFAQRQMAHFDGSPTMVELLVPLFAELCEQTGWTKDDIGFWCSGSSDYLAGRSFSFVSAVDAIGTLPPVNESHVEMDAAWALYEAWVKIQTGEVDTALVYGFGKSSAGLLRRVLALQLDPYVLTPLWPDAVSIAAMQARLGLESGALVARRTWPRWWPQPADARDNPLRAPVRRDVGRRRCSPSRCSPTRCASTTARRSPTAPPRSSSPPGDRARDVQRPAGVDHRLPAPGRRPEPLAARPAPAPSRRRPRPRLDLDGVDVAELHAPFSHQELMLRDELGPRRRRASSTRRAARSPATRCSPAG